MNDLSCAWQNICLLIKTRKSKNFGKLEEVKKLHFKHIIPGLG